MVIESELVLHGSEPGDRQPLRQGAIPTVRDSTIFVFTLRCSHIKSSFVQVIGYRNTKPNKLDYRTKTSLATAGKLGPKRKGWCVMELREPFIITPRLLPGVKIGNTILSFENWGNGSDGRTKWKVFFDPMREDKKLLKKTVMVDGFASHRWIGQDSMFLLEQAKSLCSFLGAFVEASRYGKSSDNWDLFPDSLREWALNYSSEIEMVGFELEPEQV
jgi:hypothetical protein